jgi:hypothetical protein
VSRLDDNRKCPLFHDGAGILELHLAHHRQAVAPKPSVGQAFVGGDGDGLYSRAGDVDAVLGQHGAFLGIERQLGVNGWNDDADALATADLQEGVEECGIGAAGDQVESIREMRGGSVKGCVRRHDAAIESELFERLSKAAHQTDAAAGRGDEDVHAGFRAKAK